MKKNVGFIDRIVRVLLFVIAALLYFTGTLSGTSGLIVLIAGAVLLLTSLMGFCPIYFSVGISSLRKKPSAGI